MFIQYAVCSGDVHIVNGREKVECNSKVFPLSFLIGLLLS